MNEPSTAVDVWEISNPHDKCYFHWNDPEEVWIALLFLGSGKYGAWRKRDNLSIPVMLLSTEREIDAYSLSTYGKPIQQLVDDCDPANIAKVFASFRYAGERTSITDLGAACEYYAKQWARVAAERAAPDTKAAK